MLFCNVSFLVFDSQDAGAVIGKLKGAVESPPCAALSREGNAKMTTRHERKLAYRRSFSQCKYMLDSASKMRSL